MWWGSIILHMQSTASLQSWDILRNCEKSVDTNDMRNARLFRRLSISSHGYRNDHCYNNIFFRPLELCGKVVWRLDERQHIFFLARFPNLRSGRMCETKCRKISRVCVQYYFYAHNTRHNSVYLNNFIISTCKKMLVLHLRQNFNKLRVGIKSKIAKMNLKGTVLLF